VKSQTKLNAKCVKAASQTGADVSTCADSTTDAKIVKGVAATASAATNYCSNLPPFGYVSGVAASSAARDSAYAILGELFGEDIDSIVSNDKTPFKCQSSVLKAEQALFLQQLGLFQDCERDRLSGESILAVSAESLEPCYVSATDTMLLAKPLAKLTDAVADCGEPFAELLPGACPTSEPLACLVTRSNCQLCRLFNAAQGLGADCDLFDDGLPQLSCED
jgi:hypothetical protein